MEIKKVRITRKAVVIDYHNEGEEHAIVSRDIPLPSFVKAVENLAPVLLEVLHLPNDYIHGLTVTGLTLVDKQDTWLVCITAKKELTDCNSPFNIATPLRFLAVPGEEGSYSPPLKDNQVDLINEVISEAKGYVGGQRAQGTLPLTTEGDGEEAGPTEPEGGDVLDFGKTQTPQAPEAGEATEAKAKRGKKRSKQAS